MPTFGMMFRNLCLFSFGLLILDMSTASAAIIYVPSQSGLTVSATAGHASNGPYDEQRVDLYNPGPTSYTNTLSAAANDSYTSGGVTYYASASASSSLDMSADVVGGIFTAAGSYTSAATGWLGAGGNVAVDMRFIVTTPYSYTLDLFVSQGTCASYQLWGTFQNPGDYLYSNCTAASGGVDIHQSGMLLPGFYDRNAYPNYYDPYGPNANPNAGIYAGIGGAPSAAIGGPTGNFQYTLTLTSVPVPAAIWLFGSGLLGLIGMARRKAA